MPSDRDPNKKLIDATYEQVNDKSFDGICCGGLRRKLWMFLERPGSSTQAKLFELFSTLFVVVSVMGLSFGTVPDLQVRFSEFIRKECRNGWRGYVDSEQLQLCSTWSIQGQNMIFCIPIPNRVNPDSLIPVSVSCPIPGLECWFFKIFVFDFMLQYNSK